MKTDPQGAKDMEMDMSVLSAERDQEVEPTVIKEEPEDEWDEDQNDDKQEILLPGVRDIAKIEPEEDCPSSPSQSDGIQTFQESCSRASILSPVKQSIKRKRPKKTTCKRLKRQAPSTTDTLHFSTHDDTSSMHEPNDIIIKPESMLTCPPSLENYTEEEIFNAFKKFKSTASRKTKISNHLNQKSMYGKVFTLLTEKQSSKAVERKYLYDLWVLKYKDILSSEADELRKHIKRYGRTARRKQARRLKQRQQQILDSVRVVYNDTDENNTALSRKCTSENAEANYSDTGDPNPMIVPKTEMESDLDADYTQSSPIHHMAFDGNDNKLRQKPVIAIVRLESTTLAERDSTTSRALRCRKRISRKKYSDNDDSTSGSNLDIDDDDVPCDDPVFVKVKAAAHDDHQGQDVSKIVCKICGRPLDKFLIPFHMRTHFSLEEQKQLILKRRESMKKMEKDNNVQNGISTSFQKTSVSRIQQLQWLIAGREKRIEQMMQHQQIPRPKPKRRRDRNRRKTSGPKFIRNVNGKYVYDQDPVQCAHCGKVLKTIYQLRSHEVEVHGVGEGNSFPCLICGRPFKRRIRRTEHTPTHLSSDEYTKFVAWSGNIEEFINRLNTGEDLDKPPTEKAKGRKDVHPTRKIPRPRGRPRKDHHRVELDKSATNAYYELKNDIGVVDSQHTNTVESVDVSMCTTG